MTNKIDISREFLICRHLSGFRLIARENLTARRGQPLSLQPVISVNGILSAPYHVYFTSNSVVHELNDACLSSINLSRKRVLKQDYSQLMANQKQAKTVVSNDLWVIENECQKIFYENVEVITDTEIHVVSFKAPWYDERSRVIGIFGCSVVINPGEFMQSVDNIIALSNLFLLPYQSIRSAYVEQKMHGQHFTRREIDVIQQVVHGKTLREVAENLRLSTRTVEAYFENIKRKAGVTTKSELIQFVREKAVS